MGKGVKRKAADVPVEDFGFAPDSEDGIEEIKSARVKVMKKKKKPRATKNTKKEAGPTAKGNTGKTVTNKKKGKTQPIQDSNSDPSADAGDGDDEDSIAPSPSNNAEKNKKKKERKKRAKGKKADLFGDAGWTPVEVDLDAMLAGDNEGFFGLEELDSSKFRIHASAGGAVSMEELTENEKSAKEASKGKGKVKGGKDVVNKDKKVAKDNSNNNSNKNKQPNKEKGTGQGQSQDTNSKSNAQDNKSKKKKQSSKEDTTTTETPGKSNKDSNKKSQGRRKGDDIGPAPKAYTIDSIPDTPQVKTGPNAVSIAKWEQYGLCTEILVALQDQGFSAPTPIQVKCLPLAIQNRQDVIGAAETGSGKTLAFALPMLQRIHMFNLSLLAKESQKPDRRLKALVLSPTRELAVQIESHIKKAGKYCQMLAVTLVGGISKQKQDRLLSYRPDIIVGTPGRVWEYMEDGHEHMNDFSNLMFFVLDEADRMIDEGHYAELTKILDHIKKKPVSYDDTSLADLTRATGASEQGSGKVRSKARGRETKRQVFLFSATLTLPAGVVTKRGRAVTGDSSVQALVNKIQFQGKPQIVDMTAGEDKVAKKVVEAKHMCLTKDKDYILYYFLHSYKGRTLVFANSISSVRRLAAVFKHLGIEIWGIHASMQQRQRLKNLERFQASESGILVATDVAARGLDIPNLAHVIHYQTPRSVDLYVHRSGRTARASATGASVMLVAPDELKAYKMICRSLDREDIDDFPVDATLLPQIKERVNLARKIDSLVNQASKATNDESWFLDAAKRMDIILDDSLLYEHDDDFERKQKAGKLQELQNKLKEMLKVRLFSDRKAALKHARGLDTESQGTAETDIVRHRGRGGKKRKF